MKTMKRHFGLYYGISFVLMALTIAMYVSKPALLVSFPWLNQIALALAVLLVVTPWGSKKPDAPPAAKLSLLPWLGSIVTLECALLLLYFAIAQFNHYFVILDHASTAPLIPDLQKLFWQFGLYPWALIAIFAVSFALHAFGKQQDTYLGNLVTFGKKKQEATSVIVNATGRAATIAALASTLVITTFIVTSIATSIDYLKNISGFTGASMGLSFLMLFLALRRNTNAALLQVNKYRPAMGVMLLVVIWCIILTLAAIIVHYSGNGENLTPSLVQAIIDKGWPLHWQLFSQLWWLMFVPITAIFIARISRGYTVRAIILATLALPALISCFLLLPISGRFQYINFAPLWLVQASAVAGCLLLIRALFRKQDLPLTILTFLPKPDNEKPRNEDIFQQRLKKMCGIFFYLFIPAGFFVTAILMALIILPMTIIILAIYLTLVKTLTTSKSSI